jgi:hypothetical protein
VSYNDTLIQEAKNLNIDPRPFQAIADVFNAWNHPYYTPEIPDQEHLRAMFDAALATLPQIEEGIRHRTVKERPIQGARSIVHVAVSGREPSRNGAVNGSEEHESNGASEVVNVLPPPGPVFVPNGRQKAMLEALEGRALRSDAWAIAAKIDKKDVMVLKKELQALGLVGHHKRLGFFRPDAPPPELEGHR